MKSVLRLATVDPDERSRNSLKTMLLGVDTVWLEAECSRYEFFMDVVRQTQPDIALVKYKQLAGGGMLKIVNQTVPLALRTLGYDEPTVEGVLSYIDKNDTIEGALGLKEQHLAVFDCAFKPRLGKRSIAWQAHVKMMAAAQPSRVRTMSCLPCSLAMSRAVLPSYEGFGAKVETSPYTLQHTTSQGPQ
jgi:hypothetical protein